MKKVLITSLLLMAITLLVGCNKATEVAWKNGYANSGGSDNSMGDIIWVNDSKTGEKDPWNPISEESNDATGGLATQQTSVSKEVEKTTSSVSAFLFGDGGWLDANADGIQLSEGESQTKEIRVQTGF